MAEEGDAQLLQRAVVEVVAAGAAAGLHVADQAMWRAGQRAQWGVELAGLEEAPEEVAVAEPARRPSGAAAGEEDVATGLVQFLGDLAAGLAAADHEHGSGRQLRRVAIVLDIDLEEAVGERRSAARSVERLVAPVQTITVPGASGPTVVSKRETAAGSPASAT